MSRLWPMTKGSYTISSRFAGRTNPVTGRAENHSGTDFAARDGTPFYACAGGTVQHIGPAGGYGQWIVIDHPSSEGGGCTEYGHMWNAFAAGIKAGQWVNAGQLIGYVGSNGQSTGPHLHLTVWEYGYGGRRIDPESWLAGASWPGEPAQPAPAGGLTAEVLARVMGCTVARAAQMLPGYVGAMAAAGITSVNRAAMFAAQLGHESVGLQYMEEIASGADYEWRKDLGNTQPGDGVRYKGSGPIQLTGRNNFRAFTKWANDTGHADLDFEAQPHLVRSDPRWGFLAASWYWTVARPQINSLADRRDLEGVTRAINGGLNGIADRRTRYDRALALGDQLLPREDWFDMATEADLRKIVREEVAGYCGPIGHDVKRVAVQMGMDADDAGWAKVPGWVQGGNRSFYDLLSTAVSILEAIANKVGIPVKTRTFDTLPDAPKDARNPKLKD